MEAPKRFSFLRRRNDKADAQRVAAVGFRERTYGPKAGDSRSLERAGGGKFPESLVDEDRRGSFRPRTNLFEIGRSSGGIVRTRKRPDLMGPGTK